MQAARGRVFAEGSRPEDVLVISHGYWQRRFGGAPAVVGRTVGRKERAFTVIGVAPKEFRGTGLWTDMDLWMPVSAWSETQDRDSRTFAVVGRLRGEIAVRLAIGCGRSRLIRLLPALVSGEYLLFRLDHRVLLFTLGATVLTGVLFGLMPALRASRPNLVPALRAFAPRDRLVVAQVALSLVLLAGAGVLLRSFLYCLNSDLGFARKNALIVRLDPGLPEAQTRVFYGELLERARALPGVKQAGLVRRALGLAAIGAAIGIAGALSASHLLSSLVVGVSPRDPATLASACALLIAVAVAATLPPAQRAGRVDPSVALHYE